MKRRDQDHDRVQNEYAKKKENIDQMKKDCLAQRFKEKQDIREKMIEKQALYLAQIQSKED
jgi:hypothetical protein